MTTKPYDAASFTSCVKKRMIITNRLKNRKFIIWQCCLQVKTHFAFNGKTKEALCFVNGSSAKLKKEKKKGKIVPSVLLPAESTASHYVVKDYCPSFFNTRLNKIRSPETNVFEKF